MKKKIYKKDFTIKCRRTGCRLNGMENQVVYEVFTADRNKMVKGGFYRWEDADRWLSENIKIANMILNERNKQRSCYA